MPNSTTERADLHMHSVHSDGCHRPPELVEMALAEGLRAISLTDHDTIDGWPAFASACSDAGIEAIPGVELSAHSGKRDTHILGYWIDPDQPAMIEALTEFRQQRLNRARRIVTQLNEVGVGIEFAAVQRVAGEGAIGRPHIAEALVQGGYVSRFNDAFRQYIGIGKPGYAAKAQLSVRDAVELIHQAGGVAVLAHPSSYFSESEVNSFIDVGLDGVEIIHPRNRPEHTKKFRALAEHRGVAVSGGSDFHGADRGEATIGHPSIPYAMVEQLKARKSRNGHGS